MMYKFIELPDKTEITHSDLRDDGTVSVHTFGKESNRG